MYLSVLPNNMALFDDILCFYDQDSVVFNVGQNNAIQYSDDWERDK